MRIGFNALSAENRSGTGRYASQLLPALAALDARNTYVVLLRRDSPLREQLASRPNVELHPVAAGGPLRRLLFEGTRLAAWVAAQRIDLFHGPAFVTPARCSVPCVVTIHDLVFRLFPESVPWSRRLYYRRAIPRSIQRAARILCDSANTARDLREHFAVEPERIVEAPLGIEQRFFSAPSATERRRAREAYGVPERFVLTVGTLEPRKNLPVLLHAYAHLRARRPDAPGLVVVGRRGWGMRDLRQLTQDLGIESETHFPGFAADADLPVLYHLADVFVCVSLYEGFGLPVLEAMAARTPVVAADNSSIPEVTSEAARLVDARNPNQVAQALEDVLSNPEAARQRAEAARRRAETFTWRATAEKTLAAYEAAVSAQT